MNDQTNIDMTNHIKQYVLGLHPKVGEDVLESEYFCVQHVRSEYCYLCPDSWRNIIFHRLYINHVLISREYEEIFYLEEGGCM